MSIDEIVNKLPRLYGARGVRLPDRIREALDNYAINGTPPGGFLRAVLCNDLQMAVALADDENLVALPAIVGYAFDNLPRDCRGSASKVDLHIALNREERR